MQLLSLKNLQFPKHCEVGTHRSSDVTEREDIGLLHGSSSLYPLCENNISNTCIRFCQHMIMCVWEYACASCKSIEPLSYWALNMWIEHIAVIPRKAQVNSQFVCFLGFYLPFMKYISLPLHSFFIGSYKCTSKCIYQAISYLWVTRYFTILFEIGKRTW